MKSQSSNYQCEYCKKSHDGSYGSGRFCSKECARGYSSLRNREERNKKISESCSKNAWQIKYKNSQKYQEIESKRIRAFKDTYNKKRQAKKVIAGGDILDINNQELEKYRKTHPVCEICGRKEIADTSGLGKPNKLSVDHNHDTKSFRGLLCQSCNRLLGWYENQHENIEQYLYLHDPEWRNGKRS